MDGKAKKLRNLRQNQGKSEKELLQEIAVEEDTSISRIELFARLQNKDERKLAKTLLSEYLSYFEIENVSDRGTLGQLIYLEVMQYRLQTKMNELYDNEKQAIPLEMLEVFQKNGEVILKLKVALGLTKPKNQNSYDALQHLMKRHEVWREENQASRQMRCPHCSQMIWLRIRAAIWEAQKHPFFRDTFLYNRALFDNLDKTVEISKQFIASVFETSPDYIGWVVDKLKKESYRGQESQESGESQTSSEEVQEIQVKDAIVEELIVSEAK